MTPLSLARKIAADPTLAEKWLPHKFWASQRFDDFVWDYKTLPNAVAESAILWHWQTLIDADDMSTVSFRRYYGSEYVWWIETRHPDGVVSKGHLTRIDALTAWVAQRTGVTA